MKLHEMVSEPDHPIICDPCRLLPAGLTPFKEIARETMNFPGGQCHVLLVEDEETGIVSRQFIRADGHLGAVRDDC
jgi:hypothetical protein